MKHYEVPRYRRLQTQVLVTSPCVAYYINPKVSCSQNNFHLSFCLPVFLCFRSIAFGVSAQLNIYRYQTRYTSLPRLSAGEGEEEAPCIQTAWANRAQCSPSGSIFQSIRSTALSVHSRRVGSVRKGRCLWIDPRPAWFMIPSDVCATKSAAPLAGFSTTPARPLPIPATTLRRRQSSVWAVAKGSDIIPVAAPKTPWLNPTSPWVIPTMQYPSK